MSDTSQQPASTAATQPRAASRPRNALARSKRRTRQLLLISTIVVIACAAWASWPASLWHDAEPTDAPAHSASAPENRSQAPALTSKDSSAPYDLAAFNAPLWVNPPVVIARKAEPPAPPPPPPLRIQLLAITLSDPPQAIFYNQETDKLITVSAGDTLAGHHIQTVDTRGVTLAQGASTRRLHLRPAAEARPLAATAAEDLAALMGKRPPAAKTPEVQP